MKTRSAERRTYDVWQVRLDGTAAPGGRGRVAEALFSGIPPDLWVTDATRTPLPRPHEPRLHRARWARRLRDDGRPAARRDRPDRGRRPRQRGPPADRAGDRRGSG